MKEFPHRMHFLGIGGISVSALAQVALARGARVSGSDTHADPATNPAIARLIEAGATVHAGHNEENVPADADLVIASAAIKQDNPEIRAARSLGVPIISRAEFLGELMAAHKGPKIAVAGTHGKTTTTAMLGVVLERAGWDPTVFVGGEVAALGGNLRIGADSGPFVAEACEAYDSFLSLRPDITILTNVEADHLDHYGTEAAVIESFRRFLGNMDPDRGKLIAWTDDPGVSAVLANLPNCPTVFDYGVEQRRYAGSRGADLTAQGANRFDWHFDGPHMRITLQVPGRHNVLNALAAATVASLLGVPHSAIGEALAAFSGAKRRQEVLGEPPFKGGSLLVMDDYAHHPTEIRATLAALRSAYPDRRLVAVFQPHLYSRTRDFLPDFAEALSRADALFVTDVYAAREQPVPGVQASDIVALASHRNSNTRATFVPDKRDVVQAIAAQARAGDVAVFLGAGDIREQGERLVDFLGTEEGRR